MGAPRSGRLTPALGALALGCALWLAALARHDRAARDFNAAVARGDWAGAAAAAGRPAVVGLAGHRDFARAVALLREDRLQPALSVYHGVDRDRPGGELAAAARYNMANAYLQRAQAAAEDEPDVALPLVELAKQGYRELLRDRPGLWDAKYNLERALQRFPDPEDVAVQEWQAAERGPRAVITIQADKELP